MANEPAPLQDLDATPIPTVVMPPFHRWCSLPTKIWDTILKPLLEQKRLIGLHLEDETHTISDTDLEEASFKRRSQAYTLVNKRGKIMSGKPYRISRTTKHRVCPFFLVNKLFRRIAQNFYRVQMPCDFMGGDVDSAFYFNPEYDVLHLQYDEDDHVRIHSPERSYFINFIHDAQACDPQGIGILCVGFSTEIKLPAILHKTLPPLAYQALESTMANLENVFFIGIERPWMIGQMPDRSYPLYSRSEFVELHESDPRSIEGDVKNRVTEQVLRPDRRSPGWMLLQWRQIEYALGLPKLPQEKFAIFLTWDLPGYKEWEVASRSEDDVPTYLRAMGSEFRWKAVNRCSIYGFWVYPIDTWELNYEFILQIDSDDQSVIEKCEAVEHPGLILNRWTP